MLQLYALPLSGYCTKVRIVLRIKEIPFSETPPLGRHYSSEEYQREMPPGSMPSINHDGFKLFDSEAIVEYLEDCWPDPAMRASDPQQRGRQRAVAQFHNTRLEPVVRSLFVHIKSPEHSRDNGAIDSALQNFQVQLRKLDLVTSLSPFVGGNHPSIADCGFPATMYMGKGSVFGSWSGSLL